MASPLKKSVPAAQALLYTIERALEAIEWLEENEREWQKKYAARKDGYILRLHSRILADIISVYITTLAENTGSGHSLVKSYAKHDFVKKNATAERYLNELEKEGKLTQHGEIGQSVFYTAK